MIHAWKVCLIMAVSYKKLFHKLVDLELSNAELAKKAGITLNVITRMRRNEYVSLVSVEKICLALQCGVEDVLEFTD